MSKSQLQVYTRIKPPSSSKQVQYQISASSQQLQIQINRSKIMSFYKDNYDFKMTKIFAPCSTQQQIFSEIGIPVIHNCLTGFNGTIFTYGQTGSGKTYTMNGGNDWKQRGIMPRILARLFEEIAGRSSLWEFKISISFIEIYNENGYDLFNEKNLELPFEKWSKIVFYEDEDSVIQTKNLTTHVIRNEEQGIDLLMKGNHIKKVSSTLLNQSSSRSHCIFVINVQGKNLVSGMGFVSKLNLVDLAGSERLSKSQVEGNLLCETKAINLSLSYLEQVIIALNDRQKERRRGEKENRERCGERDREKERGKIHVPYRNSLMTTILKDSLGGNCKTVMIATISIELENIDETISTLRFSQRVGQLENEVVRNEKENFEGKCRGLERENEELRRVVKEQEGLIARLNLTLPLAQSQSQSTTTRMLRDTSPPPPDPTPLTSRIQHFFNDRTKTLEVHSLKEAALCFATMKDLYQYRMKEYITELTFISEKLHKYDELLTRKKTVSLREFAGDDGC